MARIAGVSTGGKNLDRFFADVESFKEELNDLNTTQRSLHSSNETLNTLHSATAVRDLRSKMDADAALALKKAKLLKLRLESLDRANAANRAAPGCGPGSSTDRTRTSVVAGLRKMVKDSIETFAGIRERVAAEYRDTVKRRYYAITGEEVKEETLEAMVETGEGERFLQRAIMEQGRGLAMDVVAEIRERHGAVTEIERSLAELQQVFMDMAVVVAVQGEEVDDIERQVGKAASFVGGGTEELGTASGDRQKNRRKWTCIGIIIMLVVLSVVLPIIIPLIVQK